MRLHTAWLHRQVEPNRESLIFIDFAGGADGCDSQPAGIKLILFLALHRFTGGIAKGGIRGDRALHAGRQRFFKFIGPVRAVGPFAVSLYLASLATDRDRWRNIVAPQRNDVSAEHNVNGGDLALGAVGETDVILAATAVPIIPDRTSAAPATKMRFIVTAFPKMIRATRRTGGCLKS